MAGIYFLFLLQGVFNKTILRCWLCNICTVCHLTDICLELRFCLVVSTPLSEEEVAACEESASLLQR